MTNRHASQLASKPNKEVKHADKPKGTVKVTNIIDQDIIHWNGVIKPGKSGKVAPYQADLLRRKKQAI
tara:strand:- start:28968 stop:29171 length:204 start_codon:yes stop_codon:yes gene_type:complete